MDRFIHFRRNEFLPFFVQTGLLLLLYIIDTKSNRHYRINYPSPGSISVFCFQTLLIVLVIWFILEYRVVEGREKTKDIMYTIVWYTLCRALSLFAPHTHTHTRKISNDVHIFPFWVQAFTNVDINSCRHYQNK